MAQPVQRERRRVSSRVQGLSSRGPSSILLFACVAVALVGDADLARSAPPPDRPPPLRSTAWIDETPDAMIDAAAARALSPASPEPLALASLAVIEALSERAQYGRG